MNRQAAFVACVQAYLLNANSYGSKLVIQGIADAWKLPEVAYQGEDLGTAVVEWSEWRFFNEGSIRKPSWLAAHEEGMDDRSSIPKTKGTASCICTHAPEQHHHDGKCSVVGCECESAPMDPRFAASSSETTSSTCQHGLRRTFSATPALDVEEIIERLKERWSGGAHDESRIDSLRAVAEEMSRE